MKELVLSGIILLSALPAPAQKPVSFLAEYIDFKIEGEYFSINGLYVFLNRTDKSANTGILFPFTMPAALIDSIGIMNLNTSRQIVYKKREKDIVFNLLMNPFDTVTVHLCYRQPLARINTYILTSTQTWGTPLEKAVYTMTTDKKRMIRSFSFPPDSFITDAIYKTYYWSKTDFDPTADFEVTIDR
jgi:hypothetical protein